MSWFKHVGAVLWKIRALISLRCDDDLCASLLAKREVADAMLPRKVSKLIII